MQTKREMAARWERATSGRGRQVGRWQLDRRRQLYVRGRSEGAAAGEIAARRGRATGQERAAGRERAVREGELKRAPD